MPQNNEQADQGTFFSTDEEKETRYVGTDPNSTPVVTGESYQLDPHFPESEQSQEQPPDPKSDALANFVATTAAKREFRGLLSAADSSHPEPRKRFEAYARSNGLSTTKARDLVKQSIEYFSGAAEMSYQNFAQILEESDYTPDQIPHPSEIEGTFFGGKEQDKRRRQLKKEYEDRHGEGSYSSISALSQ